MLPHEWSGRPSLKTDGNFGFWKPAARVIPDAAQPFVKRGGSDLLRRLHLVKNPKEAVHGAMQRLRFPAQQLVASDQCVILSPCTTECKAIRQRKSRLLGVSEFLCKRVGLQLTEMRSPN